MVAVVCLEIRDVVWLAGAIFLESCGRPGMRLLAPMVQAEGVMLVVMPVAMTAAPGTVAEAPWPLQRDLLSTNPFCTA